MLRTDDLEYQLPPDMIATRPAEPRDSARMLVLWRSDPQRPIEHRQVRDLPEYLHAGDALVFNTTAVIPARLVGRRADTGGRVEGLYLGDDLASDGSCHWRVMLKAGGKLKAGLRIELVDPHHRKTLTVELIERDGEQWIVRPIHNVLAHQSTPDALAAIGWTPLPPYILHARGTQSVSDGLDREWYQTVYAQSDHAGSFAAPTAGLHFTPSLLNELAARGVKRIELALQVGLGTFKPITAPTLEQHAMHRENYEVPAAALAELGAAMRSKESPQPAHVIAVGTTSVRTLESLPPAAFEQEAACAFRGQTNLLIAPPYRFRVVDGLLTNFHLPRSTLLALVAAMIGLERVKAVYGEAITKGYRFYSYGDAMLILP